MYRQYKQRRVLHVHNMLDISMICFPYVVMGVGQIVIAGTTVSMRKTENGEDHPGRRVTRKIVVTASLSMEDRRIPGSPVLLPS